MCSGRIFSEYPHGFKPEEQQTSAIVRSVIPGKSNYYIPKKGHKKKQVEDEEDDEDEEDCDIDHHLDVQLMKKGWNECKIIPKLNVNLLEMLDKLNSKSVTICIVWFL